MVISNGRYNFTIENEILLQNSESLNKNTFKYE